MELLISWLKLLVGVALLVLYVYTIVFSFEGTPLLNRGSTLYSVNAVVHNAVGIWSDQLWFFRCLGNWRTKWYLV